MKLKQSIYGVICAIALMGAPAFAAQDVAQTERITVRIHNDATLKDVHVAMSPGGVVTLTGTVATSAAKARAARLATGEGVTRVDNRIVIDATTTGTKGTITAKTDRAIDKAAEGTKEGVAKTKEVTKKVVEKTKVGAERVAEASKDGAVVAVDKTKEGVKKAGNEITDAFLLSAIKTKFVGEDVLKGSDINVDVDGKAVTLRGTVPTEAARARALQIARNTGGVNSVTDRLLIGSKK